MSCEIVQRTVHDFLLFRNGNYTQCEKHQFAKCHSTITHGNVGYLVLATHEESKYIILFRWSTDWCPQDLIVYMAIPISTIYIWNEGVKELCGHIYGDSYHMLDVKPLLPESVSSVLDENEYSWHDITLKPLLCSMTDIEYHKYCDEKSRSISKFHMYIFAGCPLRSMRKASVLQQEECRLQIMPSNNIIIWVIKPKMSIVVFCLNLCSSTVDAKLTKWILTRAFSEKVEIDIGVSLLVIPGDRIFDYCKTLNKDGIITQLFDTDSDWYCVSLSMDTPRTSLKSSIKNIWTSITMADYLMLIVRNDIKKLMDQIYGDIKSSMLSYS